MSAVAALTDINVLRRLSVNEMIRICTANRIARERCQTDSRISGLFMDKLRENLLYFVELHNYGCSGSSLRIVIPDSRNPRVSIASFTIDYRDLQDIETDIEEIYRYVDEGSGSTEVGSYSYNRDAGNRYMLATAKGYDFISLYIQPSLLVEILSRLLDLLSEDVEERLFVQKDGTIIAVNNDEVLALFGEEFLEEVWVKLRY
jgi:hypothetical protein